MDDLTESRPKVPRIRTLSAWEGDDEASRCSAEIRKEIMQ
jgi:hypothetical protein